MYKPMVISGELWNMALGMKNMFATTWSGKFVRNCGLDWGMRDVGLSWTFYCSCVLHIRGSRGCSSRPEKGVEKVNVPKPSDTKANVGHQMPTTFET